jgi:hypothetical protein
MLMFTYKELRELSNQSRQFVLILQVHWNYEVVAHDSSVKLARRKLTLNIVLDFPDHGQSNNMRQL